MGFFSLLYSSDHNMTYKLSFFSSDQNSKGAAAYLYASTEPGGEIAIDQRYDVRKFMGPYSNII